MSRPIPSISGYTTNDADTPYAFHCNTVDINNNSNITNTMKIDAFNSIYDVYYANVIKSNNAETIFDKNSISAKNCIQGKNNVNISGQATTYCPQNNVGNTNGDASNYFYTGNAAHPDIMKYKDLRPYLDDCANNLNFDNITLDSLKSATDYASVNTAYTDLPIKHNELINTRKDLDRKMQEILATKGSIVNEQQNYIDGSVYTTLLWTVLASSLIFYTFTKI